MPRIRHVKPTFWQSETISEVSFSARLTFIGMWNFCDDHGVAKANPRLIKAAVFPLDEGHTWQDVELDLKVLAQEKLITLYEADGIAYLHVVNWYEHQKPNRPQPSTFPPPPGFERTPEGGIELIPDEGGSRPLVQPPSEDSRNVHGTISERSLVEVEREVEVEVEVEVGESARANTKRHPLPDTWQPNDTHSKIAAELRLELTAEATRFRDHAQANGRKQVDWNASFRKWLRSPYAKPNDRAGPHRSLTAGQMANGYRAAADAARQRQEGRK